MTYYEELGIPATASREEILQAYQYLARFTRSDDLRMDRLNGILAVLDDPAERERYDRSLSALARAVSGNYHARARYRRPAIWMWRIAIATATAMVMLLLALSSWQPQLVGKPAPSWPRPLEPDAEWEPLATYSYESHVPMPPMPFPEEVSRR